MLFDKQTYATRRRQLCQRVGGGIILLPGNNDSPMNYPANTYKFHQDSTFLYFYGLHREGLCGIIDADTGREWLVGDDISLDDIVWFGAVASVADMAADAGVDNSAPMSLLTQIVAQARRQGRTIHFLPPYRHDWMIQLMDLTGIHPSQQRDAASLALIEAVVELRARKSDGEVEEIERAMDIGYEMHTTAMRMCRPGVTEQQIAGHLAGIALSRGNCASFQTILSMHGEIQHGYPSARPLESGRLMLCDCGAETNEGYCSDNTRVTPVSGRFTPLQRDIYLAVLDAHDTVAAMAAPGVKWWDCHFAAARVITEHLKAIGLMRGNTDDALEAGAHAMFFVHGLGHMMGMDVHDMEGLGQIHVGFDDEVRPRLDQFGTNCLRCGRRMQEGFVMTDEPGIYFIPALIDDWRSRSHNAEFINFDIVERYRDFGGIRLEDDLLITPDGCRYLGKRRIPITPDEVEACAAG
ncbi:MAG: aminopeptidase P N-terminal domain-containing protein [Bacteroidaceae bacterium]|nr:aminopeptidase P N-terminal domain-containing protein [Bacteroidaceae bacterium]